MKKRLLLHFGIVVFVALLLINCENPNDPPRPEVINIAAINGLTAPVTGGTPVTAITATEQYTGTVVWSPAHSIFQNSTVYFATITIAPKNGYTLEGVTTNFFTVMGVNKVNNDADSGVITAIFPRTAGTMDNPAVIDIQAIEGIAPIAGETPKTTVNPTAQYTGTVTWSPADNKFDSSKVYTATITLTPKAGFTFKGITVDFFTVAEATTVSNSANSGVVTAVFPTSVIQTTVIGDYNIRGIGSYIYNGSARIVTVTAMSGASEGAVTVKYNGSTIAPSAIGTYTVTFDVAAATGWNAASGLSAGTLIIVRPVEMVSIPGGSFQMGNPDTSVGWDNERPVHTVTLTGFYMGKYPVTQAQYQAVMGSNPSRFSSDPASGEVQGNRPVECVSWYDTIEFCNALSIQEGLNPYYTIDKVNKDPNNTSSSDRMKWTVTCNSTANGYRLPTEAQWEYAAKGGNGTPGNYTYSGSNTVDDVAWYYDNSDSKTHEVGKKQPNGLGIYDMSGNVWEWCWDWYGGYSSEAQTDPQGAAAGDGRVERGGSWGSNASYTRSVVRYDIYPYLSHSSYGFRLVRP
jgi:formylglycine-generating enzyme required for sulfatase activity